jgi:hypothetical protein
MKTVLTLSVALFLATASFAQANVKSSAKAKNTTEVRTNKANAVASASAQNRIEANEVSKMHKRNAAAKREERKTVREQKRASAANEKGKLISGIASQKGDAEVKGKEKGALISGIASDGKSHAATVRSDSKTTATTSINDGIEKTKVKKMKHANKKASSAVTLHSGAASSHAVKIKPVSVKTNTNAGLGVKIK